MKVIVFGATGSVGRLAVEQLLTEGHDVTAFARRIDALGIEHEQLRLFKGNAMRLESVVEAMV